LGARLYEAGAFKLSRHVLEIRFGLTHAAEDAYNVACCLSRLEQRDTAFEWLEKALDAGWTDMAAMEGDADLQAVRSLDGFARLRSRMPSAG
jgi:hypothetical protein